MKLSDEFLKRYYNLKRRTPFISFDYGKDSENQTVFYLGAGAGITSSNNDSSSKLPITFCLDILTLLEKNNSDKQALWGVYNKGYISEENFHEEMKILEAADKSITSSNDPNITQAEAKVNGNTNIKALGKAEVSVGIDVYADLTVVLAPDKTDKTFDFLLYLGAFLMPAKDRKAALGDMEENYYISCEKFGARRAKKMLARDVAASALPIVKSFLRSVVIMLLKTLGLYKLLKVLFDKFSGF